MGNCMAALLGLAVVLTIVFYAAAPQLLVWFGASEATLPYALEYTRIYVLGSVFVLLVMGMNPFVTTQGFAKFSMMTTVIGAVCNIVLDPILIFGFKMGVAAPPSQPFSARAVSAVWVLWFLCGKTYHPQAPAALSSVGTWHYPSLSGPGRFFVCDGCDRKHSQHQF